MTKSKILIIEDEIDLSQGLKLFLVSTGYEVKQAFNGQEAVELFNSFNPDIILLDILLPDTRGSELCKIFRMNSNCGIIFLTALDDKTQKLNGYKFGGDDYITKPFDIEILLSKINALNKRLKSFNHCDNAVDTIKEIGHLTFDFYNNDVSYNDKHANLTITEFKIIYYLASNPSKYCSSSELLNHIYNLDDDGSLDSRTISVHIATIRKKLKKTNLSKNIIQTKYNIGYKYIS